MKIGLVTGEYPPMEGGVGAFTREVAVEFAAAGHEVYLFTRTAGTGRNGDQVNITAVPDSKWGWRLRGAISRWAQKHSLDIINIQFQTAAFDMHPAIHFLPQFIPDVPSVITFHDLRVPYLFPKAGPLRNWIVRHLASKATGVIATDRVDLATLKTWGCDDATWIPIGSNITTHAPADYNRERLRSELGVQGNNLLVSYFGFLNESKGGLVLIEAMKILIESGISAHLVMIGGRAGASDATNLAYGQLVDDRIDELGLKDKVHWTGFVLDPEVSAYFYASDVTALPYLDGVSLRRGTLMAALAHGRAIITTDGPKSPAELQNSVKLVEANSAPALAQGIRELWADEAQRRTLELAALAASKQFEWDSIAQETIRYFEELLSG